MATIRSAVDITGSPQRIMRDEAVLWETAVTVAIADAGSDIQKAWRGQIRSAGLGNRLARTVRTESFPKGRVSASAAAIVFTRADDIIGAHDEGSLITSRDGFWLAIPTEAAGRGRRGKKPTPGEWEKRTGQRLRFVFRAGRPSLLVAEGRTSRRGVARSSRRPRLKSGRFAKNIETIPIFILVPQVKLPKRLDLLGGAQLVAGRIDQSIVNTYRRLR
jgi:hypothetical protein